MQLLRIGAAGRERPVVIGPDDQPRDASPVTTDFTPEFLADDGLSRLRDAIDHGHLDPVDVADQRQASPLTRPGKILCIGLNYADHAAEAGMDLPDEPLVFAKSATSACGPQDPLVIPRGGTRTDWEVELGVVVGATAHYLPDPAAGEAAIAGYVVSNDVSERSFQLDRGGQWIKGKSCPTFNPFGPALVTADCVDPTDLRLGLTVNGDVRQDGSTATMVRDPGYVIWYLSQFLVLEPGDLINTGTPAGVGMGMDPPTYLRPGDVMEAWISGLGRQRQVCVDASGAPGQTTVTP